MSKPLIIEVVESPQGRRRKKMDELELGAAQELNEAVQCLERKNRAGAMGFLKRAEALLDEAEAVR